MDAKSKFVSLTNFYFSALKDYAGFKFSQLLEKKWFVNTIRKPQFLYIKFMKNAVLQWLSKFLRKNKLNLYESLLDVSSHRVVGAIDS